MAKPGAFKHPGLLADLFAVTAGFVDTCSFVALAGLFTAHVTGNFVVIGAVTVGHGSGLQAKLLALPTFVAAIALARLWEQRAGSQAATPLLLTQAALLALFAGLGLAAEPILSPDQPLAIAAGLAGVAAMALQNAASRGVFLSLGPTTIMTGNVTQLTLDLVDLAVGRAEDRPAAAERARKTLPAILLFAVGCAGGAFAFARFGFTCLALPVVIVLAIAALHARRVS